jgi:hypothetical protein
MFGEFLLMNSFPNYTKIKMQVTNAYHILPEIARSIVLEGLEITSAEIHERTVGGSSFGRSNVEDKWANVCLITCFGGIAVSVFFMSLVSPIVLFLNIPELLVFASCVLASLLSFAIIFFLTAFHYNVIDDSRPSPFYQLENSSEIPRN